MCFMVFALFGIFGVFLFFGLEAAEQILDWIVLCVF